MKRSIIILFSVILSLCRVHAQSTIDDILQEIETNNTTLSALRQQSEADKIGNKTGIYLENPEVEFHYLWGSPSVIGQRTDISASQSFDFPTAYNYKRKLAEGKNSQVDIQYESERKNVLLDAQKVCIELVYLLHLQDERNKRLQHAEEIAIAYQAKYDKGDVNILEKNKAHLNLLNAKKGAESGIVEIEALSAELKRLNGGSPIVLNDITYSPVLIDPDFDQWYTNMQSKSPELQYVQKEILLGKQEEKLTRAMNLPKFSAGYMSEKTSDEHFQGVMVGISIPLWENKNTVKRIKAQTIASSQLEYDTKIRLYNQMKERYDKARSLQAILADYRETLSSVNSSALLLKALETGEISLIEYMMELSVYYDTVDNILQTERDLQSLVADLYQWNL